MTEEELPGEIFGEVAAGGPHRVNPRATGVLRRNSIKSWTKPAPSLYPHQWSWDSAFIALGLAHVDNRRATSELETLFESQWATGKVPHIIFNPEAPPRSYFPDAERWNSSTLSEDAPAGSHTSGLCQPPVHAIAVQRIWVTARSKGELHVLRARRFLHANYPRLFAWHRYLATARDPEGSGLVTIYHPWESGTDNSPRWDRALHSVEVGDLPPYTRYDLQHVTDPSHRPSDAEYDRYLWLLEHLKRARYDESAIYDTHPFLVKDVLFSAILVAANVALLEIAGVLGAPAEDRSLIEGWIERGRNGLERRWDADLGLCLDYDLLAGEPLQVRTVAGFAPLIAGNLSEVRLRDLLQTLDSQVFAGHEGLRWPLPPSTSPEDPGFHPRSYWRGPVWPVANWLLWWSLIRAGEPDRASRMRRETLGQLARGGFAEYFEPFTGEPLGSHEQSWTAAVALDMLAAETNGFS
jgi:glucosylglycerate hydrolase